MWLSGYCTDGYGVVFIKSDSRDTLWCPGFELDPGSNSGFGSNTVVLKHLLISILKSYIVHIYEQTCNNGDK